MDPKIPMTSPAGRNWTHRVYKTALGNNGRRVAFHTAATFGSETAAREYAASFASEQAGVASARVVVIARKGGTVVAEYVAPETAGGAVRVVEGLGA